MIKSLGDILLYSLWWVGEQLLLGCILNYLFLYTVTVGAWSQNMTAFSSLTFQVTLETSQSQPSIICFFPDNTSAEVIWLFEDQSWWTAACPVLHSLFSATLLCEAVKWSHRQHLLPLQHCSYFLPGALELQIQVKNVASPTGSSFSFRPSLLRRGVPWVSQPQALV